MLSLLFPATCIACGVLLRVRHTSGWPGVLCVRCGVAATVLPPGSVAVDGTSALLPYQPPWSTALGRLKFGGKVALAGPLGRLLATCARGCPPRGSRRWDAIVPVPLHRRRRWLRGFDQSVLLARAAASGAGGLPVWEGALRRVRATPPQSRLPAAERPANVAGAFVVPAGARVSGRRLLLVDDVTTTGATLNACRRALRSAGAAEVGAVALLRTVTG